MAKWLQYTISGLGVVIVGAILVDTYLKGTEPARETQESINEINEALDKIPD